jgi:hypothetical protein
MHLKHRSNLIRRSLSDAALVKLAESEKGASPELLQETHHPSNSRLVLRPKRLNFTGLKPPATNRFAVCRRRDLDSQLGKKSFLDLPVTVFLETISWDFT